MFEIRILITCFSQLLGIVTRLDYFGWEVFY